MKKFLLLVLSLVALVCTFTFCASAEHIFKQGETITFGSYPQSKVTDSSLISKLNSQSGSWVSYKYYISVSQSDFMKYKDVTYNGSKYRAVTFSKYRPFCTSINSATNYSAFSQQDNNGYSTGITYWFKYEPLKWKILDPVKGLVLCTSIIDSQDYYPDTTKRTINGKTVYANNWEYSSIRTWLNNNFYNTSFTSTEKTAIKSTNISNIACEEDYSEYNANNTVDKIYLLSYDDIFNTNYGFPNSNGSTLSRQIKSTDYAQSQGLWVQSVNGYWRLRTSGSSSDSACYVDFNGYVSRKNDYYDSVIYNSLGIVPALNIDFNFDSFQSNHKYSIKNTSPTYLKTKATCTNSAVYYFSCSICGAKGTDTYPDGSALGHTGGTANCVDKAKCTRCGVAYGSVNVTNHKTVVTDNAISTTCTTAGKTAGSHCSACGKVIVEQSVIPEIGHAYKDVVKTKATFGKNGKIESTCQYCGEVRSTKTIKAIEGIYQDGYVSYDESISGGVYNYTGKAIKPAIEVYDTAGKIIPTKYYTVSYSNNVDIGTGIITVKFKGNYTGTAEEYFDIYCDHVYKKTVTKATLTKDGKTVKTCTNCGKKSTTVIPKIKTVALSATTYTCNNSERKPSVTVKDTKGKVLKKGTDYSVSYSSGRIKPGTYTVTVTFKGNYSGSKKLSYKIGLATVTGLKQTSGKGLCLTWNKVPGATGYIIQQYISSEKKYKDVKTVSTNSYKKSSASGVKAQIRIVATYGSIKSSPSAAISAKSK